MHDEVFIFTSFGGLIFFLKNVLQGPWVKHDHVGSISDILVRAFLSIDQEHLFVHRRRYPIHELVVGAHGPRLVVP